MDVGTYRVSSILDKAIEVIVVICTAGCTDSNVGNANSGQHEGAGAAGGEGDDALARRLPAKPLQPIGIYGE